MSDETKTTKLVSDLPPPATVRAPELSEERFLDQGEVARGGMGAIHKLYDRAILRTVAEKRLHESVRLLPGAAARFLEEAQITGQLEHPNIVPVYDISAGPDGAVNAFSMKLVRGKTLKQLIDEAHAAGLPGSHIELLLQVFLKVCDAIAFAHSRGVIHRDLKPDNVMVASHGQVYVMDWGVARLLAGARPSDSSVDLRAFGPLDDTPSGREGSRAVVGTPAYMAPEQAQGRSSDIDERTDVFGLGAILYRVLTNHAPFAAKSSDAAIERARAGQLERPEALVPGLRLPPGLVRIATRALAVARTDRYPSVEALRHDVESFLRGGGWFRTLAFRAGTVIVRQGEAPDAAYIILRGHCEAFDVVDGNRRTLRKMGPGEVFGETSIFTSQRRTATVVALDDVEVTEITLDAFEHECGERSWMRAFVTALAERFLEADREARDLKAQLAGREK